MKPVLGNTTNQPLPQTLQPSTSKSHLTDMKHKLHDIQNNKQYLEKKIYEYEKKLNELKGGNPTQDKHTCN
jgi:hypothetical protein